jgi:hypothetical protein
VTPVLALGTRWRDDQMATLHNLSAEPAKVRLPDDPDEAAAAFEYWKVHREDIDWRVPTRLN